MYTKQIAMAQQTAVEWLVNELLFIQSLKEGEITESNKGILTTSTIEQAKQMEREQISEAHRNGAAKITLKEYTSGDKYYNETYGQEREYLKESTCEYSGLRSVQSYDDPKK